MSILSEAYASSAISGLNRQPRQCPGGLAVLLLRVAALSGAAAIGARNPGPDLFTPARNEHEVEGRAPECRPIHGAFALP